jgi:hypothetical protein
MSIFNTPQDVQKVKKASEAYIKAMDKVAEARKNYCQILIDVNKEREKQSATITETKDKKAKEIFVEEHDKILEIGLLVDPKEQRLITTIQQSKSKI